MTPGEEAMMAEALSIVDPRGYLQEIAAKLVVMSNAPCPLDEDELADRREEIQSVLNTVERERHGWTTIKPKEVDDSLPTALPSSPGEVPSGGQGSPSLAPRPLLRAVSDADAELNRARSLFPPFHSAHEGYAVLLEEVRELEAEVFKHQSRRDMAAMRKEAIQVAAMAMRFVLDVCDIRETQP